MTTNIIIVRVGENDFLLEAVSGGIRQRWTFAAHPGDQIELTVHGERVEPPALPPERILIWDELSCDFDEGERNH